MSAQFESTPDGPIDFRAAFRGTFRGVLQWSDLDRFWDILRGLADDDWFIYAIGEAPPAQTAAKNDLLRFIEEVDALLRKEHEEEFCGIVYADRLDQPTFVKIFDPNNLGVVCGYSDNPPLPGWILSRIPPADLKTPVPLPGGRRRWWQRIFRGDN